MVGVLRRMRGLRSRLLAIRSGSGSIVLPKDVKRIHMRFAEAKEHMGSKKFWRNELVRMQYHNPAVLMTVDRPSVLSEPSSIAIHFVREGAPQTSNSATSSPAPGDSNPNAATTDRVQTIDTDGKTNSQILEELVLLTRACQLEPTPADVEEGKRLEEERLQGDRTRKMMSDLKARKQKELDMLEAAKTGA